MTHPDPQRKRVYAWEGEWRDFNTNTMKLKQLRQWVRWACAMYGVKPPAIKQHHTREYSYSQGRIISFRKDQMNCAVALHEAAHFISGAMFGEDLPHHSPEWLSIYLWLLLKAAYAPKVAILASAKAKKLVWIPLWLVSPRRLARRNPQYHARPKMQPPAR